MDQSRNGHAKKIQGPPHIFVGLSTHDYKCHTRFLMSMMGLVGCNRFKLTLSNVSSGGIHKARNNLAWEFLTKSDAEWYLSIDGDISFQPDMVSRLMSLDQDIVGAPYCHKKPEVEWSARMKVGADIDPKTGLQEVTAIGTGFLLIKRHVFEKMRDIADDPTAVPLRVHTEDWAEGKGQKKWDLFWEGNMVDPDFDFPVATALTEDFGFCYWARKAGFKIMIDTTFHVMHWDGGRGYPEQKPVMKDLGDLLPMKKSELVTA